MGVCIKYTTTSAALRLSIIKQAGLGFSKEILPPGAKNQYSKLPSF